MVAPLRRIVGVVIARENVSTAATGAAQSGLA
jgi:hypothetical protein